MKIIVFDPLGSEGQAMYDHALSEELSLLGNQVFLVSCEEYTFKSVKRSYELELVLRGYRKKAIKNIRKAINYVKSLLYFVRLVRKINPDVIHYQFPLLPSLDLIALLYIKLILRIKVVYTVHDVTLTINSKVKNFGFGSFVNLFDGVILHSELNVADFFNVNKSYTGLYAVIPHGNYLPLINLCNVADVKYSLLDGQAEGKEVLSFIGSLLPYKGIDILVKAFFEAKKSIRNLHLVIAGSSRGKPFVIEGADSSKDVTIVNKYLSDSEVLGLLSLSDLIVLPYRYGTTSGVALLAMTYGKPVLASDISAFRSIIDDGETGFLFKVNNVKDLEDKIIKLMRDKPLMSVVAKKAMSKMVKEYSWKDVAAKTETFYASLLNTRGS